MPIVIHLIRQTCFIFRKTPKQDLRANLHWFSFGSLADFVVKLLKKSELKEIDANDVLVTFMVWSVKPVAVVSMNNSGPMRANEWIALARTAIERVWSYGQNWALVGHLNHLLAAFCPSITHFMFSAHLDNCVTFKTMIASKTISAFSTGDKHTSHTKTAHKKHRINKSTPKFINFYSRILLTLCLVESTLFALLLRYFCVCMNFGSTGVADRYQNDCIILHNLKSYCHWHLWREHVWIARETCSGV